MMNTEPAGCHVYSEKVLGVRRRRDTCFRKAVLGFKTVVTQLLGVLDPPRGFI